MGQPAATANRKSVAVHAQPPAPPAASVPADAHAYEPTARAANGKKMCPRISSTIHSTRSRPQWVSITQVATHAASPLLNACTSLNLHSMRADGGGRGY